jgi:ribose transport system permease protein
MTTETFRLRPKGAPKLEEHRGLIVAIGALVAVFVILDLSLSRGFSYFDASSTAAAAATLILAAIGETIVLISGGMDLSPGAVISLTNCLLVVNMSDTFQSMALWSVLGVLVGAATGLVNAFFIVVLRIQPIVVTLATMFIAHGLTLLVMREPGGTVPQRYANFFMADAIPGVLPMPFVVILFALLVWALIRASSFSTRLYAIGSDDEAARYKGLNVPRARFAVYFIAGGFYGAAGVFLTAQTGSGDPTVGPPMLLPIFVAVVLGGTSFKGGRGGCLGTAVGGLTVMLIVNMLLVLNISTYYSTTIEGLLLILAVMGGSIGRESSLWTVIRLARIRLLSKTSKRDHWRVLKVWDGDRHAVRYDESLPFSAIGRWIALHRDKLRFILPSYVAFLVIFVAAEIIFGGRISIGPFFNSILVLTSFLAVLALGQGTVVIAGGLDLSVPSMITFAGVLLTGMTLGGETNEIWAIPMVVALCAGFGALSGVGIVSLGVSPFIMTLAMNGILFGLSLVYCNGTPRGTSPPVLTWLMTGQIAGITPVVIALGFFAVAATLLLSRTVFGRYVFAIGNSPLVARFAGVPVNRTLIAVYALSGACSALVGLLLVGFSGQAFNDMGDPYLLPSIAVVVVGGTLMTGGRGHYLGMFGGALLLTGLGAILSGSMMPIAVRDIILGAVVLTAVIALRERAPS